MNSWTNNEPPQEGVSNYYHTSLTTPLGKFLIEWKSWKDSPSYDIMLDDLWLGVEYDLLKAKEFVNTYMLEKCNELIIFLTIE